MLLKNLYKYFVTNYYKLKVEFRFTEKNKS